MLMLLACLATFFFISSNAALMLLLRFAPGGLLVMVGSGSSEDKVLMLDKAAVMVAAKAKRGKDVELSPKREGRRLQPTFLPAVIAAFMAMLGKASGSIELLRLAGMVIPTLAHMAAALALAISRSCSLPEGNIKATFPPSGTIQ